MRLRRTFAAVFAVLLALMLLPGGGAAATDTGNCTTAGFMFMPGDGTTICGGTVFNASDPSDAISLYQAALQTDTANNQYMNLFDNYIQDTEQVAWLKAENQVAQAAENGLTATTAEVDAKEALNSYYATHQRNLYDRWNLLVAGIEAYSIQADNISYTMWDHSVSSDLIYQDGDSSYYYNSYVQNVSYGERNVTLADGSSMVVRTLEFTVYGEAGDDSGNIQASDTGTLVVDPTNPKTTIKTDLYQGGANNWDYGDFEWQFQRVNLLGPTADYDDKNYLSSERFRFDNDRLSTQLSDTKNNTETFVSGVYSSLESGEIDPADVESRTNKMFNYLNQFSSDNASFNEGLSALIAAGFDTPASANTSYLNISFNPDRAPNSTYQKEGMLLSSDSPTGGWEIGKTYNDTDANGTVFVHSIDGSEYVVNGTFTIHSAFDDNGTEIEDPTLSAPDRDYGATNTSELQELLIDLAEDSNRIEDLQAEDSGSGPAGGSSGSSGSDLFSSLFGWIPDLFGGIVSTGKAIVLFIVALVVLSVVVR